MMVNPADAPAGHSPSLIRSRLPTIVNGAGGGPPVQLSLAAVLAAAAMGSAILATTWSSLEWGVTAVLIASVASFGAVSASLHARRAGLVLPFSFIGLWAVGYGIASLAWRNPSTHQLAVNSLQLRQESLPFGLALATVALLSWTAGYGALHLRLIRAAISAVRRWSTAGVTGVRGSQYSLGRIAAVYAIGLAARFALLALGRYSYITADLHGAITQGSGTAALLSHFEFFTTVGLLLLAFVCFQAPTAEAKTLLAIVLALEIPLGLLSGMRSFVLLRLFGVILIYFLVRRRIPAAASITLLAGLALLSSFTDAYRGEVRNASGTTAGATEAARLVPSLLKSTFTQLSIRDVVTGPSDLVTDRLRFVDEVAIVGQRTPSELPYIPASETLLEATTVLIPRAAWPTKPVYTTGLQYARNFWNQPESVVSSRSPTYPGDAYYRGGWLSLIIIMALLGGLMAAIATSLSPRSHPSAIPMFVVAWTALMDVESSLSLLGAGIAQSLIITAIAMRWASGKHRKAKAPTSAFALTADLADRRLKT